MPAGIPINVLGTYNLSRLAKEMNCRFHTDLYRVDLSAIQIATGTKFRNIASKTRTIDSAIILLLDQRYFPPKETENNKN